MIINSNTAAIIADDLTGANDTALQFKLNGADTNILLDTNIEPTGSNVQQTWAISTESRNISPQEAFEKVKQATEFFVNKLNPDFFYKKIDSTIRGNIAVEVMSMLEVLCWDGAIIMPAFPQEGRITVGGYHLAKGVPIGKTEMAMDPHSPILESHVPTLLKSQLKENQKDLVGTIDLRTILNGAGPILIRINELIKEGKKLIVADATSITDIEQIALAINKCDKSILPVGTAAGAQVLSKYWLAGIEKSETEVHIGNLPKLIVSGTATQISANQIKKLEQADDYENVNFIALDSKSILDGVTEDIVERIASNLKSKITVCIHTSDLIANFDGFSEDSYNAELTRDKFASKITDYLAELTKRVMEKLDFVLITLGGETSYKCCKAIESNELRLIDEVVPAISISQDINNRWIITKSGNLGNSNTLIEILNYLARHE